MAERLDAKEGRLCIHDRDDGEKKLEDSEILSMVGQVFAKFRSRRRS